MKNAVALFAVIILAACGGARSPSQGATACVPDSIPEAWAAAGPLYRACDVERAAVEMSRPRMGPFPGIEAQQCHAVLLEFVVDSLGRIETQTARVVRGNSQMLANAVMRELIAYRYRPAMKDGAPVRQIVRQEHAIASTTQVVSVRSTGSGTPVRPGDIVPPSRAPASVRTCRA